MDIFNLLDGGDKILPRPRPTGTATVSGANIKGKTEATPKPKIGGVFGGIQGFFDNVMGNPLLLMIVLVVVILIVGKVF